MRDRLAARIEPDAHLIALELMQAPDRRLIVTTDSQEYADAVMTIVRGLVPDADERVTFDVAGPGHLSGPAPTAGWDDDPLPDDGYVLERCAHDFAPATWVQRNRGAFLVRRCRLCGFEYLDG